MLHSNYVFFPQKRGGHLNCLAPFIDKLTRLNIRVDVGVVVVVCVHDTIYEETQEK